MCSADANRFIAGFTPLGIWRITRGCFTCHYRSNFILLVLNDHNPVGINFEMIRVNPFVCTGGANRLSCGQNANEVERYKWTPSKYGSCLVLYISTLSISGISSNPLPYGMVRNKMAYIFKYIIQFRWLTYSCKLYD